MMSHVNSVLSSEALARLASATVGIAGAGGLGSNCAMHLARMGVKRFVIADHDRVESSNLNRQFFFAHQLGMRKVEALRVNLLAITADLTLEIHPTFITSANVGELFDGCDAVVEALDGVEGKQLMAECYFRKGTFLVSASGIGGWGDADRIATRQVTERFYMVGDGVSEVNETTPPLSAMVGIAAAKQADLVFSYLISNRQVEGE